MSIVSNIKNISILTSVIFLLSACGGGSGGSTSTSSTSSTVPGNTSLSITNGEPTTTSTDTTVSTMTDVSLDGESTTTSINTIVSITEASEEISTMASTIKTPIIEVFEETIATETATREVSEETPTTETPETTTTPNIITVPSAKAVHSGQVKDSSTGTGLENVKVSLGESTTTTDENGFYTLSDLTVSEEAVVNFEKEGYLLGSTQIQLKSLSGDNTPSSNYLEYSMGARLQGYKWDYNSSDEIYGAHIMIDASVSYRDINGNIYNGTNTAELIYFDITTNEGKLVFPGAFKGINTNGTLVQFVTYGLVSILLEDSNGDKLSLADGETIVLGFDAVSSLEKPNTLPLWYFDYEQGLWVEEGYAELQEDGTYKGEISHIGIWSVNRALEEEAGIYRGRIVNEDGTPMSDVRLYASGENWISSDLSTDENGVFEIEVIPDSSFQLTAYDYKNKYGAKYNGTIVAIASGDVVED